MDIFEKFSGLREYKEWLIGELFIADKRIYDYYVKVSDYPVNVWSYSFPMLWANTKSVKLKIYKALVDKLLVTFILTNKGRLFMPCIPFGRCTKEQLLVCLKKCADFCLNWNLEYGYENMSLINPINKGVLTFLLGIEGFEDYFRFESLTGLERFYSVSKLCNLYGKEFSNIRNKVNRFKRDYPSAIIRRYKDSDYEKVMKLGEYWEQTSGAKYKRIFDGYYFPNIVKNYKELDHLILVIELNGEIIGMTTGGILPNGEAWGCLTKFKRDYTGISETLVVAIIKEIHQINPKIELFNVGSDLGSRGLAFSKERYRPILNLERYALFYKYD